MNKADYQKHMYVSPSCETVNVEVKSFFCTSGGGPDASKDGYDSVAW